MADVAGKLGVAEQIQRGCRAALANPAQPTAQKRQPSRSPRHDLGRHFRRADGRRPELRVLLGRVHFSFHWPLRLDSAPLLGHFSFLAGLSYFLGGVRRDLRVSQPSAFSSQHERVLFGGSRVWPGGLRRPRLRLLVAGDDRRSRSRKSCDIAGAVRDRCSVLADELNPGAPAGFLVRAAACPAPHARSHFRAHHSVLCLRPVHQASSGTL